MKESESRGGTEFYIFLKPDDLRSAHLKKILKAAEGTVVDAGVINGKKGKAVITEINETGIRLVFTPQSDSVGLHPITLLLGLSRPPTVRKVLKEATALGVSRFILCGTENGEQSYRRSSALKNEKIHEILIEGAQQAYCTRLPEVEICYNVKKAVERAVEPFPGATGLPKLLALDNYEATVSLSKYWTDCARKESSTGDTSPVLHTVLAVGSERGWTDSERKILRENGYTLCSLGQRVLRTETASIAGTAVCLSGMGLI